MASSSTSVIRFAREAATSNGMVEWVMFDFSDIWWEPERTVPIKLRHAGLQRIYTAPIPKKGIRVLHRFTGAKFALGGSKY